MSKCILQLIQELLIKNDVAKKMFPSNEKLNKMDIRSKEKFKVQFANTERLKNSAIIYMQKLLNEKRNRIT